jgi:hypothetical protein
MKIALVAIFLIVAVGGNLFVRYVTSTVSPKPTTTNDKELKEAEDVIMQKVINSTGTIADNETKETVSEVEDSEDPSYIEARLEAEMEAKRIIDQAETYAMQVLERQNEMPMKIRFQIERVLAELEVLMKLLNQTMSNPVG